MSDLLNQGARAFSIARKFCIFDCSNSMVFLCLGLAAALRANQVWQKTISTTLIPIDGNKGRSRLSRVPRSQVVSGRQSHDMAKGPMLSQTSRHPVAIANNAIKELKTQTIDQIASDSLTVLLETQEKKLF